MRVQGVLGAQRSRGRQGFFWTFGNEGQPPVPITLLLPPCPLLFISFFLFFIPIFVHASLILSLSSLSFYLCLASFLLVASGNILVILSIVIQDLRNCCLSAVWCTKSHEQFTSCHRTWQPGEGVQEDRRGPSQAFKSFTGLLYDNFVCAYCTHLPLSGKEVYSFQ